MAEDINSSESFLNPSRRSYVYESTRGSSNKKRGILIIIGIIILLALVAYAVIATGGKGEEENISTTPTQTIPTPQPTEIPTPTVQDTSPTPTPRISTTPTPTPKASTTPGAASSVDKASGLDRANLKIAVQNGSGVAGAATKGSDVLKKLGYTVVSSGNADDFDYETTTIQVRSTKKAYLNLLKNDLSGHYTVGAATSDYTGTDADAVVIVGKE